MKRLIVKRTKSNIYLIKKLLFNKFILIKRNRKLNSSKNNKLYKIEENYVGTDKKRNFHTKNIKIYKNINNNNNNNILLILGIFVPRT